jgi:hypothetical protein
LPNIITHVKRKKKGRDETKPGRENKQLRQLKAVTGTGTTCIGTGTGSKTHQYIVL